MIGGRYLRTERLAAAPSFDLWRVSDRESAREMLMKLWKSPARQFAAMERERALDLSCLLRPLRADRAGQRESGSNWTLYELRELRPWLHASRSPLTERIACARALLDSLAMIHRAGLMHGALSPDVLLLDGAQVCIADVGHATSWPSSEQAMRNPHALGLDLRYVAPELTGRTSQRRDHRSDFYSFGVILFELLTGKLPFTASEPLELIYQHLAVEPTWPEASSDTPAFLRSITLHLLEKDAGKRYQSIEGIAADLDLAHTGLGDPTMIYPLIGRHDLAANLESNRSLHGREAQQRSVRLAHERACAGARMLVAVSGPSGAGKTSLIQAAFVHFTESRSLFAAGKFDQLEPRVPYAGWLQIFDKLVSDLLADPPERMRRWKQQLSRQLQGFECVLVEFVPRLALLLGPQPPPAPLPAIESRFRFERAIVRLAQTFARPGAPLVLFLDDIQWMDTASRRVLERLCESAESRSMLVIVAYRDNEVPATHPVFELLSSIRDALDDHFVPVEIGPMTNDAVAALVRAAMPLDDESAAELARLLSDRSGGNPLYIWQLLRAIRERGDLVLDSTARRWHWQGRRDFDRTESLSVVPLIVERFTRLPEATRRALSVAACIGATFELDLLARALDAGRDATLALLQPALADSFIEQESSADRVTTVSERFSFSHDRIQEAAYIGLSTGEAPRLHARIARELIALDDQHARTFEVAEQLGRAAAVLQSPSDRELCAEIGLRASRLAVNTSAFEAALRYARDAISALPARDQARDATLVSAVHGQLGQVEYLTGDHERAEATLRAGILNEPDRLASAELRLLLVTQLTLRAEYERAIAEGCDALALFDVTIHRETLELDTAAAIAPLVDTISERGWRLLESLPAMTEPDQLGIMRVLAALGPPCYRSDTALWSMVVVQQIQRILEHGAMPSAAYALPAFGGLLQHRGIGSGEICATLAHATTAMAARFDAPGDRSVAHLMVGSSLRHWFAPLSESHQDYLAAYESGLKSGNLQYAAYGFGHDAYCSFYRGLPLPQLAIDVARYEAFANERSNLWSADVSECVHRVIQTLRGLERDFARGGEGEESFVRRLRARGHRQVLAIYHALKSEALWHLLGPDHCAGSLIEAERDISLLSPQGLLPAAQIRLLQLVLFAAAPGTFALTESQAAERIEAEIEKITKWASASESTFGFAVPWLRAEVRLLRGDSLGALDDYGRALEMASSEGYHSRAAMIADRVARAWTSRGRASHAVAYQRMADWHRASWGMYVGGADDARGASSKSDQPNDWFDTQAILRTAQDVANSTDVSKVVKSIVDSVSRVSGAQRTVLMVERDGELFVAGDSAPEALGRGDASLALPRAAAQWVFRTGEPLRMDREHGASVAAMFSDPTLRAQQPAAMLCVPIGVAGNRLGALYLEHREASDAFSTSRIKLIELLGGHGAVALRNAELVTKLRSSVDEKTALLQEVHHRVKNNLQVVTTLIRMQAEPLPEGVARDALRVCQDRVRAMCSVHEMLFQSDRYSHLSFNEYASMLVDSIVESSSLRPGQVQVRFVVERIDVSLEQAVPCGLILNELVTNAMKHAFPRGREGTITLSLWRDGATIHLSIEDDGVGINRSSPPRAASLGLKIVDALTEQLDGVLSVEHPAGTKVTLSFPAATTSA